MDLLHHAYPAYPENFPLPLVLDGATGTELFKKGMPVGCVPELWITDHPEAARSVTSGYISAGSGAVLSPTFGANSAMLALHGYTGSAPQLCARLFSLTKAEASAAGVLTGGDMAPTGHLPEPYGDMSTAEMSAVYAEQARALEESGADFLMIETQISLAETHAAFTGARSASRLPIFVSFTVGENGRTMSGDDMAAALFIFARLGAAAFGTNCSFGPEKMLGVLEPLVPLSRALGVPLLAKPNAGIPDSGDVFSPCDFGSAAEKFLRAGIYILGGCCGSDPRHIAEIKRAVSAFSAGKTPLPDCKLPETDRLFASPRALLCAADCGIAAAPVIETDESFCDSVLDAEGDFLRIRVTDTGVLINNTDILTKPLSLSGDREMIERFAAVYDGVPYIETAEDTRA